MIRKNIYSRITESIIQAHNDQILDSAMEDDGGENMGKKIVAIITADPDQDLDWESEYEPFGATELSDEDEKEAMEHEGMESDHELCPSCGYDVDCEGDDCEDEDDYDYDSMDVKDILVDILQELKGEGDTDEDAFETSDENPMFGGSDDSESTEDDEEEDYDSMLSSNDSDQVNEDSDSDSDSEEDNYDEEEDFEDPTEVDDAIFNAPQEQEEDEVYTFDALDNV